MIELDEVEHSIDYKFNDKTWLKQALTHRSYAHEKGVSSNERLEFLGDAVLELIIREFLFRKFPNIREGDLSQLKAEIAKEDTLAQVALAISLDRCLFLGRSEIQTGGRSKKSILADALEALIGAVYLDGGLLAAQRIVLKIFRPFLQNLDINHLSDYKSAFQNYLQSNFRLLPRYRVLKTIGPDHDKEFEVGVYVKGKCLATGWGKSRKAAEQVAARKALAKINEGKEL